MMRVSIPLSSPRPPSPFATGMAGSRESQIHRIFQAVATGGKEGLSFARVAGEKAGTERPSRSNESEAATLMAPPSQNADSRPSPGRQIEKSVDGVDQLLGAMNLNDRACLKAAFQTALDPPSDPVWLITARLPVAVSPASTGSPVFPTIFSENP